MPYTLYILKNNLNGKRYVGQTTCPLNERLAQHKCVRNGDGMAITRAIAKYGFDAFSVTAFDVPTMDALNTLEEQLIDGLGAHVSCHGYNIQTGGRNFKMTDEQKRHLRDFWSKPENKKAQSERTKAAWRGDEERRKKQARIARLHLGLRRRCSMCGDKVTFDPIIDWRICPRCRQLEQSADELGMKSLRGYRRVGTKRTVGYFAGFDPNEE